MCIRDRGIARNCILGKVFNARWILERAARDHGLQIDLERVKKASGFLQQSLKSIKSCQDVAQLRGYEGEAASVYFGVFNELILQQKKDFNFSGRNKRPPMDNVNAMLSFVYTLSLIHISAAISYLGLPGSHSWKIRVFTDCRDTGKGPLHSNFAQVCAGISITLRPSGISSL